MSLEFLSDPGVRTAMATVASAIVAYLGWPVLPRLLDYLPKQGDAKRDQAPPPLHEETQSAGDKLAAAYNGIRQALPWAEERQCPALSSALATAQRHLITDSQAPSED